MPAFITDVNNDYKYKQFWNSFISGDVSSIDFEYLKDVTSIRRNAFAYYTNLTSISIPKSVTSIGTQAFQNCSNLLDVYYSGSVNDWCLINFPQNINSNPLRYGARLYTSGNILLENAIITNISAISGYAFVYYSTLKSVIMDNNIETIGRYSFYECSGLENVIIGNGVTDIGDYAFYQCVNIENITFGDNVSTIGTYAFRYCAKLTSITLPATITDIGSYAFGNCTGLESITVDATVPPTITNNTFANTTCPIYVPANHVNDYKIAPGWSSIASRIEAKP